MTRLSSRWGIVAGTLLFASCAEERIVGNTFETENSLAARTFPVDSLLSDWNRPASGPTVVTMRLDSSTFDFRSVGARGEGLRVRTDRGDSLPFAFSFWDSAIARGRIQVRVDDSLRGRQARIRLQAEGPPRSSHQDPLSTWKGIPDSIRQALTSILLDDFEDYDLVSRLPARTSWVSGPSYGSTIHSIGVGTAGGGKPGNSLGLSYSAPTSTYVVINIALGNGPRSLRSMDSLVANIRGSGTVDVAFEHLSEGSGPKAWSRFVLSDAWSRIRLRPTDFAPADSSGSNKGWGYVRDSVTHLTFILMGGTQFKLDDVRLHGLDRDDLR
ncbi:MAG: hypothetical protein H6686_02360 [Fibrobacteria bacterium]|nr:hypothetical protein [Fibrobacteria bacterium]